MTKQFLNPLVNRPGRARSLTGDDTISNDDSLVVVDTSAATAQVTITLPDARVVPGNILTIKVPVSEGGGGQDVLLQPINSQTIDGDATLGVVADQSTIILQSDGSNWQNVSAGMVQGASGGLYMDTLANLQAKGTSDGISVGDMAFDLTSRLLIYAISAAGTSSVWGFKRRRTLNPNVASTSTSAGLRFASWASYTVLNTADQAGGQWLCRWPTRIFTALYIVENDPGDVAISIHKNGNGTPLETITNTVPADTPTLYTFTTLSTFDSGDQLSIGLDPVNARTSNEYSSITFEIEETVTLA